MRNFRMIFGAALLLIAVNSICTGKELTEFQAAILSPSRDTALPIQYRDVRFWIFVPADYGKDSRTWPLLMYLHGSSHRGTDLKRVRNNVPIPFMDQEGDLPFIVVAPQCPKGERWDPDKLILVLDKLSQEMRVDENRVYLTGMSLGAFGTWELAAKYPDRFAAIAPISGGSRVDEAERLVDVPAWVFHGSKDRVVPFNRSTSMVNALKKLGGDVKFTVFQEGHDIWTEAYSMRELYSWLLQQSRENSPTAYSSVNHSSSPSSSPSSMSRGVVSSGSSYREDISPASQDEFNPNDEIADLIRSLEKNNNPRAISAR